MIAGGPISWNSKKQNCVTLSTAEAEYVSGSLAVQDLIWTNTFIKELDIINLEPVLNIDNQGTICISENEVVQPRSKHIDIRKYFLRDKVINGEIKLKYCPTTEMIADIMTKPLNTQLFTKFAKMLGLYAIVNWFNGIKGKSRREGVLDLESGITHEDPVAMSLVRHGEFGTRSSQLPSSEYPGVSGDWLRFNETSEVP
jgi:hypothetical protein